MVKGYFGVEGHRVRKVYLLRAWTRRVCGFTDVELEWCSYKG